MVAASAPTVAQTTPADTLGDRSLVSAAIGRIRELNNRQAEALARVLVQCSSTPNDSAGYDCNAALSYLRIVALNLGPLGTVLASLNEERRLLNAKRSSEESLMHRWGNLIAVSGDLERALRMRFATLDAK
jgi:hypothetical protein